MERLGDAFGTTVIHWQNQLPRYTLTGVECQNCDTKAFPPRAHCLNCNSKIERQLVEEEKVPQMEPVEGIGPG